MRIIVIQILTQIRKIPDQPYTKKSKATKRVTIQENDSETDTDQVRKTSDRPLTKRIKTPKPVTSQDDVEQVETSENDMETNQPTEKPPPEGTTLSEKADTYEGMGQGNILQPGSSRPYLHRNSKLNTARSGVSPTTRAHHSQGRKSLQEAPDYTNKLKEDTKVDMDISDIDAITAGFFWDDFPLRCSGVTQKI